MLCSMENRIFEHTAEDIETAIKILQKVEFSEEIADAVSILRKRAGRLRETLKSI